MNENFWNDRYSIKEYFYGEEPNEFFKTNILKLKPGKILLPAEGEGRNAVFAATLGWDVYCFDTSSVAMKKALSLSDKYNVAINYILADVQIIDYDIQFDAIGFVFTHFGNDENYKIYSNLLRFLKPQGHIIFECFSKKQLEFQRKYNSGGPDKIDMLFDIESMTEVFPGVEIKLLEEIEKKLNEGNFHNGLVSVIDFIGQKSNT